MFIYLRYKLEENESALVKTDVNRPYVWGKTDVNRPYVLVKTDVNIPYVFGKTDVNRPYLDSER